jgi:hypothetical protein
VRTKSPTSGVVICALLTALAAAPAQSAEPAGADHAWRFGVCRVTDTLTTLNYTDYEPGPDPRPVEITGLRNGSFSGIVVLSSPSPIVGLKATAGELTRSDGKAKIPASAVRVRFARQAEPANSWNHPARFDALLDSPPETVPVLPQPTSRRHYWAELYVTPDPSPPAAVVPVWVTVKVPANAAPGEYTGTVSISAQDAAERVVPIKLTVHDWVLPDPKNFATRQLGWSSQETLAYYYDVPLWSDKHFEYVGKSLALLAELGSRYAIADICVNFRTRGNRQGMVRWIKKGDGYTYDFKPFDRYLDVVAKVLGEPMPLALNMWGEPTKKKQGEGYEWAWGCGASVTLLDPATGEVETLPQPMVGTPESAAFWAPVMAELKKRVDAHGWWNLTGVGDVRYAGAPLPEVVTQVKNVWPDAKWVATQHGLSRGFKDVDGEFMPAIVATTVWNEGKLDPHGWRGLAEREEIWPGCFSYARNRHYDDSPMWLLRLLPEEMILKAHHGVGPLGGDSWPLPEPVREGRYYVLGDTSALGPNCSTRALLAPGPDGPVATERFEAFREGVQICEVIIALDRALQEKQIDGELAKRVDAVLGQRGKALVEVRSGKHDYGSMARFISAVEADPARWLERDRQLYTVAGEVGAKLNAK